MTKRTVTEKKIALTLATLNGALERNHGPAHWRAWKEAQARAFVDEIVLRAPRVTLLDVSVEGDLNLLYLVDMPVPRRPVDGRLAVSRGAVFHISYVEEWRHESPPGWGPIGLVEPNDPFHPNCRPSLRGAICIGDDLPPGIPINELAFTGFHAVQLQMLTLDPRDPHGVLNAEAREYFRQHTEYLPLSRAGLFEDWNGLDELEGVHRI